MEEAKKNNNKIIYILCLIIGVILVGVGSFLLIKPNSKNESTEIVSLKDDFYESINYEKLKNAKIPKDKSSWSVMYEANDRFDKKKEALIDEITSNPDYTNENIDTVVELYTDYDERNERGISELQSYFDMIDNAKTIDEFNIVLLKVSQDLDSQEFINFSITEDINNSGKNILAFNPASLFVNFDYYTQEKYSKRTKNILNLELNLLKEYGYSEDKANEVINQLQEFIKKVQEKSINFSDITDITTVFNYYTLDDIKSNIKNLPIIDMLKLYKIENEDKYVFFDYEHYKALDELYIDENLGLLKEYLKLSILHNFVANFTTDNYFNYFIDFVNTWNGTKKTVEDYRKDILTNLKTKAIGKDLYLEYEKRYFNEENKNKLKEIITDIKEYYKTIIENCDWLEDQTKEEALKKLETMKVKVGYQEKDEEDELKYVSKDNGGTLISNIIMEKRHNVEVYNEELHKESNHTFDDFDFNAYYMQTDNSINFTAAFYELIDGEEDYYKLLGYFGTVVGHEISHAFDNTGSKFDETGNVRNWWTENDLQKYNELTKKIVDYYNKYEWLGVGIDGEKTLGENIADLAGFKAVLYVAEQKGATVENYKNIFESYADLWAEKITADNLENQKLQDTHSFNKIRVNAVLSSMDKFYEVYDIKEGDKMYVPVEERVGLW